MTNGPLAVLDKSHDDDLVNQYDAHGNWEGMLSDEDAASLDTGRIRFFDRSSRFYHGPQRTNPALLTIFEVAASEAITAELLHQC